MKEKIIEFNNQFGINTKFFTGSDVEGYTLGDTIYLNEDSDLEKVNKHELLHFFEDDETFQMIKTRILQVNKNKLDELRKEYRLRYMGLYTKKEIDNGIIDTEIAIDLLTDNYRIKYENGLKLGNFLLRHISFNLERKRYLNLILSSQINKMNLSKWDKLFILNFYDEKEHTFPNREGRYEKIQEDIHKELERLYNLSKEEFIIDQNSPDVLREYVGEIKALAARGEDISFYKNHKSVVLNELSTKFSTNLYEEYKHIVDFIKGTNYPDSFKVLMLRETLSKTYKQDKSNGKKTIVGKRNMHETIAGHMTLNGTVLDTIFRHVDDYNNFANLYFAGLEIFNQKIAEKNNITLDGVETYDMGHWIKFEGKTSNEQEYLKNAKELASLVKDTPWCTKALASNHLASGDFYVFVDNNNKPHIAVKMNGNQIDEVRGILNGSAQELEEEYRKVAISFLEKNEEIKSGKEWLRKEEWNKRLIKHISDIDAGRVTKENIKEIIDDVWGNYEYKAHFSRNTNLVKLNRLLQKIKGLIAEYFNCKEEEIAVEDIDFYDEKYNNLTKCPYRFILGTTKFIKSRITDLGNLTFIGGYAEFRKCQARSLGNLEVISGGTDFGLSQVTDLGNLKRIGGSANFELSQVTDLGNLTIIGGNAYFCQSKVTSLGKLTRIEGHANFYYSQIISLGNLTSIGGNALFGRSQITSLGNLKEIKGIADFSDSKITNFGNLEYLGGIEADEELMELYKQEFDETGHRRGKKYIKKIYSS